MTRTCWIDYKTGGDYDMWTIHYTLDGVPDLPELPVSKYTPRDISSILDVTYYTNFLKERDIKQSYKTKL